MSILRRKKIDTRHIKVTLKPIMGIKPKVYIPSIYIILITLFITFVFIAPSIRRGYKINIISYPPNASVYIDNKRVGSTPLEIQITKGDKEILVHKSQFSPVKISKTITKKEKMIFQLESQNGSEILNESYENMSNWSLFRDIDVNNRSRIPFIISESVNSYFYSTDFNNDQLNSYLISSLKLVTNEYVLSDYLRAISISASNNKIMTISSVKNTFLTLNNIINEQPNTPLLFYTKILNNSNLNIDDDLFKQFTKMHKTSIEKGVIKFDKGKKQIKTKDLTFNYIPESLIKPVDVNFIHNIEQSDFYISDKMISRKSFMDFVKLNPFWDKSNIDYLIKNDLVDNYYLNFSDDNRYITNISYFAAMEWCSWANTFYSIPEGWKIALPTENMWHAATLYEGVDEVEAWQWTSQGFYVYDHFLSNTEGQFSPEYGFTSARLVVGKNKYNSKKESGRGVQKASWCTPFLSFRPVLKKE